MKLVNKSDAFEWTYGGIDIKIPTGEFTCPDHVGHFLLTKAMKWGLDITEIIGGVKEEKIEIRPVEKKEEVEEEVKEETKTKKKK